MQQDNNQRQAYCQWRRFFMWDCSYSRDALWTSENVMWFSKCDFLNYKKSLYTKDNMVIVVAWKIDNQKWLEKQISEIFGKLPDKKSRELPLFERRFPSEHEKYIEKWINQSRIAMFIPWLPCLSEEDISCDILAEILKWRLFQRIREELWLCYWISVVHVNQINYWFFLIETWLKKDNLSFW
jgi:predicted Zn-dependent peptidase